MGCCSFGNKFSFQVTEKVCRTYKFISGRVRKLKDGNRLKG